MSLRSSLHWGIGILGAILLLALVGPLVADRSLSQVGAVIPRQPPSADYWLGTDAQGREMISVLIYGLPQTLKIGVLAGLISLGVGTFLGLLSGFVDSI